MSLFGLKKFRSNFPIIDITAIVINLKFYSCILGHKWRSITKAFWFISIFFLIMPVSRVHFPTDRSCLSVLKKRYLCWVFYCYLQSRESATNQVDEAKKKEMEEQRKKLVEQNIGQNMVGIQTVVKLPCN